MYRPVLLLSIIFLYFRLIYFSPGSGFPKQANHLLEMFQNIFLSRRKMVFEVGAPRFLKAD